LPLRVWMLGCLDAWMPGGVSGLEGFGDWKAEQL
jgi:hypothetical protein